MEVTHPDRIVFPDDGFTKGDVVGHYRRVAEHLLPFIAGRARTVQRLPKGIGEHGFMQKNTPDHYPREIIRRHEVEEAEGGPPSTRSSTRQRRSSTSPTSASSPSTCQRCESRTRLIPTG